MPTKYISFKSKKGIHPLFTAPLTSDFQRLVTQKKPTFDTYIRTPALNHSIIAETTNSISSNERKQIESDIQTLRNKLHSNENILIAPVFTHN